MIGSGWALVHRELLAAAASGRTYVLRVAVAGVLLLCLMALMGTELLLADTKPERLLGLGQNMFSLMTVLGCLAAACIPPILIAGYLPRERESGTLEVLLSTPASRLGILMAGVVGKLAVCIGSLLVFLPMGALAYAMGGLDQSALERTMAVVVALMVEFGAIACWRSVRAASAAIAIRETVIIVLSVSLVALPIIVHGFGWFLVTISISKFSEWTDNVHATPFGPFYVGDEGGFTGVMVRLWPVFIFSILCLWFAWRDLSNPRYLLSAGVKRVIDEIRPDQRWLRHKRSRRINTVGAVRGTPLADPIAWREVSQQDGPGSSWWSRPSMLLLAFAPFVLLAVPFAISQSQSIAVIEILARMTVVLAALMVVVQISQVIAQERTRGTLVILATTPISSTRLLLGKTAGAVRILNHAWLLLVGWSVACVIGAIVHRVAVLDILLLPVVGFVTLHACLWLAFALSSYARTAGQGLGLAMCAVAVWFLAPAIVAELLVQIWPEHGGWMRAVEGISPWTCLGACVPGNVQRSLSMGLIAGDASLSGLPVAAVIWMTARWWCLRHADRILGRAC